MKRFVPPRSLWCLIQEDLFPNEWLILVSCIMLNCTSRKQVEKIFPEFMKRWPTPESILVAPFNEVRDLIMPLGFKDRRTKRLQELARAYVKHGWKHARELPGIGEYGSRAWEIFVLGNLGGTLLGVGKNNDCCVVL